MERVVARDSSAFAELFDGHAPVVLGMLVKMLRRRETAEEVLQETFLQAWNHADKFDPTSLRRNNLLISTQVEDIQIQYAVDANDDGQIGDSEFPVDDLDGSDTDLIRGLELSVLTRAAIEDPGFSGPGRQAVANHTASGTSDGYRRRRVSILAVPRNLN